MQAVFLGPLLSSLGLLAALHAAELPSPDGLPVPDGIRHVRVERSDSGKYKFLHDPAIEVHKAELFAAWYNCPKQEIVGESLIRCRRSKDGGRTWGAVEVIASDTRGDGTYYVPAQLLSHGGVLHAFVGTMKGGHDLIESCAVYVLDEAANRWQPRGEIAGLFLPNCQPVKMADGNWIMAGRAASRFGVKPFIPAVAISQGDDLTGRWNVVTLQAEMTPAHCPETTVWAEGSKLLALTRNNAGAVPFAYASQDYGRTWNVVEQHPLNASSAKLYAGHLSTGERYVVFNLSPDGNRHDRGTLVIQVSRPGDLAAEKMWRVQDRNDPAYPIPPGARAFHYPCAIEHEGRLLVLYTVGSLPPRQCELAIIPIASLQLNMNQASKDAAGPKKNSVVSTRFKLRKADDLAKQTKTSALVPGLLPDGWDPALAGDVVMQRLIKVTAPHVKGAHDAEFVCVGERAYIVEHDNDVAPGHGAGAAMYCVLTVVNLKALCVEKTHLLAKAGQAFANVTLPDAQVFVPRIIRKDEHTLRTYFCSQPAKEQAVTWYRDFDLRLQTFEGSLHKAKLKTAAGTFDMEPRHFHDDAAAQGFTKPSVNQGLYIFDSFKEFAGRRYVALNNFPGKQNALAVLHDDFTTFEVIGHYNEPQSQPLSESAVNRLPDGTWMAICRNDAGNYHFTTSQDGKTWTSGEPKPLVPNGLNSKPTFDQFGGVYYLGWQENTRVHGCSRSVFNVDISRDGVSWERKYRFESPHSFQYPTFHEHKGVIWLTVTQSDHLGSSDRIMFGKLEAVGECEPQQGRKRITWPARRPDEPAVMKCGVKLLTDRQGVGACSPIDEGNLSAGESR